MRRVREKVIFQKYSPRSGFDPAAKTLEEDSDYVEPEPELDPLE